MLSDNMRLKILATLSITLALALLVTACAQLPTPTPLPMPTATPTSYPPPESKGPKPTNTPTPTTTFSTRVTQEMAIQQALVQFTKSRPELCIDEAPSEAEAWRVTLRSAEQWLPVERTYLDRNMPVWFVQAKGVWRTCGIVPPEWQTEKYYSLAVIDAQSGEWLADRLVVEPVPTPTPTSRPTIAPEDRVGPPTGPGAEAGKPYQFFLMVACGVRDAKFDGRWWVADPIVGVDPPESDWTADETLVPPHVSGYGVYGTMVLVAEDLAIFTSKGGHSFEFIPWHSDDRPFVCY